MPFITQDRRKIIDEKGLGALGIIQPGDLCYYFYKPMVNAWMIEPRWATAHGIYEELQGNLLSSAQRAAANLAWQCFFIKYVWPYELKQIEKNGDI